MKNGHSYFQLGSPSESHISIWKKKEEKGSKLTQRKVLKVGNNFEVGEVSKD